MDLIVATVFMAVVFALIGYSVERSNRGAAIQARIESIRDEHTERVVESRVEALAVSFAEIA